MMKRALASWLARPTETSAIALRFARKEISSTTRALENKKTTHIFNQRHDGTATATSLCATRKKLHVYLLVTAGFSSRMCLGRQQETRDDDNCDADDDDEYIQNVTSLLSCKARLRFSIF